MLIHNTMILTITSNEYKGILITSILIYYNNKASFQNIDFKLLKKIKYL